MTLTPGNRTMDSLSSMTADYSDASSELSDAPSLAYDGDNSDDEPCSPASYGFPTTPSTPAFVDHILPTQGALKRKAFPRSRHRYDSSDSETAEDEQLHVPSYKRKRSAVVKNAPPAPIEKLPNEIIQRIVINLTSDVDLHNLTLSSPAIAQKILPENSEIWRYRFLALYDHPRIKNAYDFCLAYKLRRFVLRTFDDMGDGFTLRHVVQLEVIRDILLESYSRPKPHLPAPKASRNIRVLTSRTLSPWIKSLLSCPFPGSELQRFGLPSKLFETIQLTLSHLVLSPHSALAHVIETSRSNYNMVKVYNFRKNLATLYTRRYIEESTPLRGRSRLFPKLKSSLSKPLTVTFDLDTNALLHIKNFWHRHLIDDSEPAGEHTYAAMTRGLLKLGSTPQAWRNPLDDDIAISEVWHGHYSAIYPWPESEKQLVERQTTADDWQNVDPMKLSFVSTNDYAEGFWPPALSNFLAFQNTIPPPSEKDYRRLFENDGQRRKTMAKDACADIASVKKGPVYIRGIAPFLDMPMVRRGEINPNSQVGPSTSPNLLAQPVDKAQRYHPFVALRIRGVIHDIPASATISTDDLPDGRKRGDHAIPGWKRIVMVMYKPNVRYLLQVLEFATEEFGGTFGTQLTNTLNTSNTAAFPGVQTTVPVTGAVVNSINILPVQIATAVNTTTVLPQSLATSQPNQVMPQVAVPSAIATTATSLPITTTQQTQLQPQSQIQPIPLTPTTPINPLALHNQLTEILHSKLKAYTSAYPPNSSISLFSPEHLIKLEDAFSPPHALDWSDGSIDHAYAYEGVIIPGGKIMMGRWWRCHGSFGAGEGKEIDSLGQGVEIDNGHDAEEEDDDHHRSDGDEAGDEDGEEGVAATGSRRTRPLERGPFVFWC